ADPPDRTKPSTRSMVISGSSKAVSRNAGAPPFIAIDAIAGSSNKITVTPEASRSSSADPTSTPSTSVIRLRAIDNASLVGSRLWTLVRSGIDSYQGRKLEERLAPPASGIFRGRPRIGSDKVDSRL